MISEAFAGLNISGINAAAGDEHFLPNSWPPHPDFPICIAQDGTVTARYGDNEWDLSPWAGYVLKLNFGVTRRKDSAEVSPANNQIFKSLVAFWLYGPKPCKEVRTLQNQYENVRQIFTHCTEHKIKASELYRFPKVIESLGPKLWPSQADRLVSLLHYLWEGREAASFIILDPEGIALLSSKIPPHEKSQTAYIPPRIWLYQLGRLKKFLDDFEENREAIMACAEYCLQAYSDCAGSIEEACSTQLNKYHRPFISVSDPNRNGVLSGAKRYGSFYQTAEKFGILSLLENWVGDVRHHGVTILSQYFNMATQVCKAYILNFTLMRIDEASKLRSDCWDTEKDPVTGETIFLLKGATTKTIDDDEACWITSESSLQAIMTLKHISTFRTKCAFYNRRVSLSPDDLKNPYLELRAYEPWCRSTQHFADPDVRTNDLKYKQFTKRFPNLFSEESLRITDADLKAALLITPSLDPKKYAIGAIWPLGWHQLRRTGAVNMSASGIVGEASVQYQLKHLSRYMTRYYGNGYYHLEANLNQEAQGEFLRAHYQTIARSFSSLLGDGFVSPHGEKRKAQIFETVSINDHNSLVSSAKKGSIAYRPILMGACTNPDPCPFGGIEYVGRCGGGDGNPACRDFLVDRSKRHIIIKVGDILRKRMEGIAEDSPLLKSLSYQLKAVENTINVIDQD